MNFKETELSLRIPGVPSPEEENNINNSSGKMDVKCWLDLNHPGDSASYDASGDRRKRENVDALLAVVKPSASKSQVVGWPPVRASRKQAIKSSKLVKVAVDGTPYLRKVDLQTYNCYQHLLSALEDMFSGLAISDYMNERAILDQVGRNPMEYVPTYEDKDGDWMMVGDVPWKMFVESCKRLRLMKSSKTEAVELAPKTISKCSSSS